jgi:hypothetical protein
MKQLSALALIAVSLNIGIALPVFAQEASREPQCNPENILNGFGRCNYGPNFSYFGDFVNGSPNGRGILTLPSGIRYEGQFIDGSPNGEGRVIFPDDSRYEGIFQEGAIINGTAFFANGDRYEGGFTLISRTEQISATVRVGTTLDGEPVLGEKQIERTFYSSQPDGVGSYIFANGNRYEGEFFSGEPFGQGTFIHTTGTVCEGYFFTRNFDGRGATCTYRNGDRYQGELRQGRPHGTGTMIKADGRTISGAFRDGQPVSFSGYGQ